MKPTFQEQKPNGTVEVSIATSDKNNKPQSNKLITRFVIAVVSLILVCGVIFGAVYFGKILTSENVKEYHGIVHREDGKTTEETLRLTNTEEEFENDDARVIYDFQTGLATYSFKQPEKNGLTDCYVVSFNLTELKTPEDVRKELKSTEFEITVTAPVTEKYEVTDVWLNPKALGQRSQNMCSGRDIYFLRNVKDVEDKSSRVKRKEDITVIVYCSGDGCRVVMIIFH